MVQCVVSVSESVSANNFTKSTGTEVSVKNVISTPLLLFGGDNDLIFSIIIL